MLDGDSVPTDSDFEKTIGPQFNLWADLRTYIESFYEFVPEITFYGKKYGWTVRYRKSGKTLCSPCKIIGSNPVDRSNKRN